MTTKVIFRKFKDNGDVIAFFPELPGTNNPYDCQSYMHVGQHGAACLYPDDTVPATEQEYIELYKELVYIGYDDLKVYKRLNKNDLEARRKAIKRSRL